MSITGMEEEEDLNQKEREIHFDKDRVYKSDGTKKIPKKVFEEESDEDNDFMKHPSVPPLDISGILN
jgi:hypothetical protein